MVGMTISASPPERGSSSALRTPLGAQAPSGVENAPERGRSTRGSRIAAARARAEAAKAVLLIAALIAFFAAMLAERGAASSASNESPGSSSLPADDSGSFEPGGITPTQSEPSTSTGTS